MYLHLFVGSIQRERGSRDVRKVTEKLVTKNFRLPSSSPYVELSCPAGWPLFQSEMKQVWFRKTMFSAIP